MKSFDEMVAAKCGNYHYTKLSPKDGNAATCFAGAITYAANVFVNSLMLGGSYHYNKEDKLELLEHLKAITSVLDKYQEEGPMIDECFRLGFVTWYDGLNHHIGITYNAKWLKGEYVNKVLAIRGDDCRQVMVQPGPAPYFIGTPHRLQTTEQMLDLLNKACAEFKRKVQREFNIATL